MSPSTRIHFLASAVFAALVLCPLMQAAPVPEKASSPRQKLDQLRKRLPALLQDKAVQKLLDDKAEVTLVRQIGPTEAKVRIVVPGGDPEQPKHEWDEWVILFLQYYEGSWTTTRFEFVASFSHRDNDFRKGAHRLMQLIDEEGGE